MLDGAARKVIDPFLMAIAGKLVAAGITANLVTLAGLCIGLAAAVAIANGFFITGLVLILISRLADGLDGSIAKLKGPTDFGGYIDIVFDFIFYGAIPLAFVVYAPAENALAGAVLIFSFYVNGASFLAYAIIAEKRQLKTTARGSKTIYFTTGLAEATETIAVFVAACLFPHWFMYLALAFAGICFYTSAARIWQARTAMRASS